MLSKINLLRKEYNLSKIKKNQYLNKELYTNFQGLFCLQFDIYLKFYKLFDIKKLWYRWKLSMINRKPLNMVFLRIKKTIKQSKQTKTFKIFKTFTYLKKNKLHPTFILAIHAIGEMLLIKSILNSYQMYTY